MPRKNFQLASPCVTPMRCFPQQCGCVDLRWGKIIVLRFSPIEAASALECLDAVLTRPAASTLHFGTVGTCCASRLAGEECYLLCPGCVILRLSQPEATLLRGQLAAAHSTPRSAPDSPVPGTN